MIYICRPGKIRYYHNTQGKSPEAICGGVLAWLVSQLIGGAG